MEDELEELEILEALANSISDDEEDDEDDDNDEDTLTESKPITSIKVENKDNTNLKDGQDLKGPLSGEVKSESKSWKRKPIIKNPQGPVKCTVCSKSLSDLRNLQTHTKTIHGNVRFSCDQCPYEAKQKISLVRHQQTIHAGVKYSCNLCDKQYSWEGDMKVHKAKVHSKIRFACEICGRLFSEKKRLTAHVNGMHLKIMKSCSVPGCTFEAAYEASVKYHVRRIHEKITVNCERCDYTCGALGDLNRHIQYGEHWLPLILGVSCKLGGPPPNMRGRF